MDGPELRRWNKPVARPIKGRLYVSIKAEMYSIPLPVPTFANPLAYAN
jgi:hypothetical protein